MTILPEELNKDRRELTRADIEALATELETRLFRHFYHNLGKGVFGLVWRVLVVTLVAIAAYGIYNKGW